MIRLTRLNHQSLAVNSDHIKFIENAPDTVLTLMNGEKIVVRESTEEVIERVVAFRRLVLAGIVSKAIDPNAGLAVTKRFEEEHNPDHRPGDEGRG
jgi:flagellar protein FlbD